MRTEGIGGLEEEKARVRVARSASGSRHHWSQGQAGTHPDEAGLVGHSAAKGEKVFSGCG